MKGKFTEQNQRVKDWLETQFDGMYYISIKAAYVRSIDPYGILSLCKLKNGKIISFVNGKPKLLKDET